MPMITGLGYTRKDKVFAEFDIEGSHYTFKETHDSKKGLYKVGIYRGNNKVFNIRMEREQINRIKENKGIANIDFSSEEGFLNWIDETYLQREFREEAFRKHFSSYFIDRFNYLQSDDNPQIEYISYLMGNVPDYLLENFYNNNKVDLAKTFKYTEVYVSKESEERVNQRYREMMDRIEAELKQYLNVHNIDYMDIKTFKNSMNRQIVQESYNRFVESRDNFLR